MNIPRKKKLLMIYQRRRTRCLLSSILLTLGFPPGSWSFDSASIAGSRLKNVQLSGSARQPFMFVSILHVVGSRNLIVMLPIVDVELVDELK